VLPILQRPLAVGAITDPEALSQSFTNDDCDLIELRLDALHESPLLQTFCESHSKHIPLLITARDPTEGGLNSLPLTTRTRLLTEYLPFAAAIDLELANHQAYQKLISQSKRAEVSIILSSHNFDSFEYSQTREHLTAAQSAGADISKAAAALADPVDLTLFESLCAEFSAQPTAIMGMGPLGPASRLLAIQHHSVLNYGYLGNQPTAPGQWPAKLLKEIIAHTPRFSQTPEA